MRKMGFIPVLCVAWMTACNINDLEPGILLGRDEVSGPVAVVPPGGIPNGGNGGQPKLGPSCRTQDPNEYCLGLKYVVYEGKESAPVVAELDAVQNLEVINSVWKQCGVLFQIDEFLAIQPAAYNLRFRTREIAELDDIREAFVDASTLLIVTTGAWDRSGGLGSTEANAWTAMPGGGPYGSVLEEPVGKYPKLIGHELGHYLNLDHARDTTNLMNAIIYENSTRLTSSQCQEARSAISFFWKKMTR